MQKRKLGRKVTIDENPVRIQVAPAGEIRPDAIVPVAPNASPPSPRNQGERDARMAEKKAKLAAERETERKGKWVFKKEVAVPEMYDRWERPLCSNYLEKFCHLIALLFHPIVFCLMLLILSMDVLRDLLRRFCRLNLSTCVRIEWTVVLCRLGITTSYNLVMVLFLVAIGRYGGALHKADSNEWKITSKLLARLPWPTGRKYKALTLARMDYWKSLHRVVGFKNFVPEPADRTAARAMWRDISKNARTVSRKFESCRDHILNEEADINFPSSHGSTLLHYFGVQHDPKYVKWLLKHLADPNVQDGKGRTPLHAAAVGNN
jgi:hypothetical protein